MLGGGGGGGGGEGHMQPRKLHCYIWRDLIIESPIFVLCVLFLTVPRQFLFCGPSLFVRWWFHNAVAIVLLLLFPRLPIFWCLRKAVLRDSTVTFI